MVLRHLLSAALNQSASKDRTGTLGHSNITMTLDTYSRVIPALHAEAATQLNTLLTTKKKSVAVNQG